MDSSCMCSMHPSLLPPSCKPRVGMHRLNRMRNGHVIYYVLVQYLVKVVLVLELANTVTGKYTIPRHIIALHRPSKGIE